MKDEEVPKHRAKKNTKRWCKGKVGVAHTPRWIKDVRYCRGDTKVYIYACEKCAKHFDMYWSFFSNKYAEPTIGSTEPLRLKVDEEEE